MQLTLRLYKTTVKRKKSLWYQIELKNVGKEKILVDDKIFRDPWAMHYNTFYRYGIYIDITAPPGRYEGATWPPRKTDGKSPQLRHGAGELHYDRDGKSVSPEKGKAVNDALAKKEREWTKQGLTDAQKTLRRDQFWVDWNQEQREEEDRAKAFWLAPGASTTTFTWAYRDPDPYAGHSDEDADISGEEKQVGDYTQLWDYLLYYPGKYRVRAVYDASAGEFEKKLRRRDGTPISPWRVETRTPYIEVEVTP